MSFEVFISHFSEEQVLADELQYFLGNAFGSADFIFRSSDDGSIRTGADQYEEILKALRSSKVMINLVSAHSWRRPWLNFEAGFAKASRATLFTVLIRGAKHSDIGTPLSQMQLRDLTSRSVVEEILSAIASATGRTRGNVDIVGDRGVCGFTTIAPRDKMAGSNGATALHNFPLDADWHSHRKPRPTGSSAEFEDFVADVVSNLSVYKNATIARNRRFLGVRQPGFYEIDLSLEFTIDGALRFLVIIECKNWSRPVGRPIVQQVIQTRDAISAQKAAIVSPLGFGRELRPKGDPEKVRVHDFLIPELGRAAPYGVYDVTQNAGWVSVGVDHDTAAFAAQSIRRWWESMGAEAYPQAGKLLITADSGGSNGARVRLWKLELQKLADEIGLEISICHLPPGTSKWKKIEHRLFSFISQNWRGKPLVSHQVIVNLIAATTTRTGLRVRAEVDPGKYPKGVKVSDKEVATIRLERDKFHGEWNYTILPRSV